MSRREKNREKVLPRDKYVDQTSLEPTQHVKYFEVVQVLWTGMIIHSHEERFTCSSINLWL